MPMDLTNIGKQRAHSLMKVKDDVIVPENSSYTSHNFSDAKYYPSNFVGEDDNDTEEEFSTSEFVDYNTDEEATVMHSAPE